MYEILFWAVVAGLSMGAISLLLSAGKAVALRENDGPFLTVFGTGFFVAALLSANVHGNANVQEEGFIAGYLDRSKIYVTETTVEITESDEENPFFSFIRPHEGTAVYSYKFKTKPPPCFMVIDQNDGLGFQEVECK